ncbi:MAG: pilus assembly protein [Actinobacteria bacterium]|nr:pilus assembly protein [Actinomycetota bacterium]
MRNRLKGDGGQALVEFALIIPVLLFVLLAIAQFGDLYNHYVTITDATRAGARAAVVSRTDPNPTGKAVQAVRDSATGLDQTKLTVTVTPSPPWTTGQQVTITASYPYSVDLVGLVVKSGSLTSTTKERVE